MNALVDEQLPPALARWLGEQGTPAVHVREVGLQRSPDDAVWRYALDHHAVLLTKDEDFVDRWLRTDTRISIVWLRVGNCTNLALMSWFAPLWPDVRVRLEAGEQLIELTR